MSSELFKAYLSNGKNSIISLDWEKMCLECDDDGWMIVLCNSDIQKFYENIQCNLIVPYLNGKIKPKIIETLPQMFWRSIIENHQEYVYTSTYDVEQNESRHIMARLYFIRVERVNGNWDYLSTAIEMKRIFDGPPVMYYHKESDFQMMK